MTRYDIAYLAASPVLGAALAVKSWRTGKYRESAPAMLGRGLAGEDLAPWRDGCLWVHAVSVGEVVAAQAMLPLLGEAYPGVPRLVTTTTETGQAQARKLVGSLAEGARYLPADFSWLVRRFVRTFRPKALMLMETELWPNLLEVAADEGVKVIALNAKISERSLRGYRRLGGLIARPLGRVSAFCAQTDADAGRLGVLSGHPERVTVTGNCKFDVSGNVAVVGEEEKRELRSALGLVEGDRVVVAGSTHRGEEEVVLEALGAAAGGMNEVVLALVPRHPERFDEAWAIVKGWSERTGIGARRLNSGEVAGGGSDGTAGGRARVVLVDRMGILAKLYAVGEVAIVAGSLLPGVGGHNLLEAAVHGVPVVYGPHMRSQPDMARLFDPASGGPGTVAGPEELGGALRGLLEQSGVAAELGRQGREVLLANRGAAGRNLEVVRSILPPWAKA